MPWALLTSYDNNKYNHSPRIWHYSQLWHYILMTLVQDEYHNFSKIYHNLQAFITYSMPLLLDDFLYIVQDVEVYSCHQLHILHQSSLILSYPSNSNAVSGIRRVSSLHITSCWRRNTNWNVNANTVDLNQWNILHYFITCVYFKHGSRRLNIIGLSIVLHNVKNSWM